MQTLNSISQYVMPIIFLLSIPLSLICRSITRQQQAHVTAVRSQGLHTKGIIKARYMGRLDWYLAFSYEDQGKEYLQRQTVNRTVYDKIHEGAVVDVAYLPDNPQEAVLVNIDMWSFIRALAIVFTIMSIIFIITVSITAFIILIQLVTSRAH